MMGEDDAQVLEFSSLLIPDVLSLEDTQITDEHFKKELTEDEKRFYTLQDNLLKENIEARPLKDSSFVGLEGLVQEMDTNFPSKVFIDKLGYFKALKMLPLVLYKQDGAGQELYIGIQGEQRPEVKIPQEEARHLSAEEISRRRGVRYNISNLSGIAQDIIRNITEDPIFKTLSDKKYSPRFLLLNVKEFDLLEKYIIDPKARKDFLGEIDEADPGEKTMWKIFERAVEIGATDVHIEALDEKTGVARYRVDGYLIPEPIPRSRVRHIVSAIKVKANMAIEEKRSAQSGGIHFTEAFFDEKVIEEHPALKGTNLRIETIPAIHDESASVRFLPQARKVPPTLEELGYEEDLCDKIREVSKNAQGLIIVTGPTGSGKTTTLYSILQGVNDPRFRILTVENPVEYQLKGLIQTETNEKAKYDFSDAVRSFLRADPDIILVGEMRDSKTRESAMQLAQTGHLVFATLHTNDAPSTIKRLYDLGATSSDLESSLTAVIAQRLTRRLCKECKEEYNGTDTLNKLFGEKLIEKDLLLYKATGKIRSYSCGNCKGTGYKGRIVVPSFWMIDEGSKELFEQDYSYRKLLKSAIAENMKPLAVSGMKVVLKGTSSLEELNGDVVAKGEIRKYREPISQLAATYQNQITK